MLKSITAANTSGAMPSDLKVRNRMLVLSVFQDGCAYTANDVASRTGISRQTVMKAIQFFVGKGLLRNTGKGLSTDIGGKRPDLYMLHCKALLVTVTMWPQSLHITLSNMGGKSLAALAVDKSIPQTPAKAFAALKQHLADLMAQSACTLEDVFGVTLSIAGTIDYQRGTLKYSSQMPCWGTDVPLGQYLGEIFCPETLLVIENAGKMTGRAALTDPGRKADRILVIFSTWGLSACLIDRGHILGGKNSLIGEIGHMVLDPHVAEPCGCGSHGCFEQLVSANWLQGQIRSKRAETPSSPLCQGDITALTPADIFAVSRKGDPLAQEISASLAATFALGLRNICLTFDPALVVFQGNYATADEVFCDTLQKNLAEFQYFPKEGAFDLQFDKRSLFDLDLIGSRAYLTQLFFKEPSLYL